MRMNNILLMFVCLIAITICNALMMNLIDRLLEITPIKETDDNMLPPKYIVKELTYND